MKNNGFVRITNNYRLRYRYLDFSIKQKTEKQQTKKRFRFFCIFLCLVNLFMCNNELTARKKESIAVSFDRYDFLGF